MLLPFWIGLKGLAMVMPLPVQVGLKSLSRVIYALARVPLIEGLGMI